MKLNFRNKIVIVTGSNSGNGLAIAKAFSKLQAKVIRVDNKFTSKLRSNDIKFNLKFSRNTIIDYENKKLRKK